jgi:putative membrane protein
MAALFAFLHHLAAFTIFGALVVELVLLRSTLTVQTARKILVADMIYGIAAGVLLLVGLTRVFSDFEKGAAYYFHNWAFHTKLTLFVLVGLVSILPTREFLRWRASVKAGQVPNVTAEKLKSVATIVHVELTAIVLILLMAALMAKGIGIFG